MFKKRTALPFLLLAAAALTLAAYGFHETELETTTVCHTAANLNRMATKIRTTLVTQQHEINQAMTSVQKLQVAAAKGGAATKKLYGPVIAAATSKIHDAQSSLESGFATALEALQNVAQLEGTQHLAADVLEMTLKPITGNTIANSVKNTGNPIVPNVPTANRNKCDPAAPAERQRRSPLPQKNGEPQIAVVALTPAAPPPGTATVGPRVCCGNSPGEPGDNCDINPGTTCTYLAVSTGKLHKEKMIKYSVGTGAQAGSYSTDEASERGHLPTKHYFDTRIANLKALEATLSKLTFKASTLREPSLMETDAFEAALLAQIAPSAELKNKPKFEQQLQKIKKEVYGSEDSTYEKKIWAAIDNTNIPVVASGHTAPNNLRDLNDLSKLGSAQAYYMAQEAAKDATAKQECKQTKVTETEDSCNKKGQNECNSPCKWNPEEKDAKKKCTLSEEGEKAAEKANQEAGGKDEKPDCSKLTTQPECEAVNKDGKKHCGWKKGEDGDTDKDTEKCRSSSFLVNKKFAHSVVSAALAALLF